MPVESRRMRQPPSDSALFQNWSKLSLQCLACAPDNVDHRAIAKGRLGRKFLPHLSWLVDRNRVPNNAVAIMFAHAMRQQTAAVPILRNAWILDTVEGCRRGCAEVRGQYRFPDYER